MKATETPHLRSFMKALTEASMQDKFVKRTCLWAEMGVLVSESSWAEPS